MEERKREKLCYCLLALIVFFLGMHVGDMNTESSFFHTTMYVPNASLIREEQAVQVAPMCTFSMLSGRSQMMRNDLNYSMERGQHKCSFSILIMASFLQYLFNYQSDESKEDGQLFSCRSMIIDYIHLKDSGE